MFSAGACAKARGGCFYGDEMRKNVNIDLGFSMEDRLEQACRIIGWLCNQVVVAGYTAIADFVCPTAETR
jgi:adenylylsulfate kinase